MRSITTLLDRENTLERAVLPEDLAILYGGDLRFPEHDDRRYVIGNFVNTLDGVVSFEVPGQPGDLIVAEQSSDFYNTTFVRPAKKKPFVDYRIGVQGV
jgi:hypothetical protein